MLTKSLMRWVLFVYHPIAREEIVHECETQLIVLFELGDLVSHTLEVPCHFNHDVLDVGRGHTDQHILVFVVVL